MVLLLLVVLLWVVAYLIRFVEVTELPVWLLMSVLLLSWLVALLLEVVFAVNFRRTEARIILAL